MTDEAKKPEAAPAEAAAPQTPELTINDLNALRTILDVATTRGAFKAGEMESIGKVYNRLNTFLESVTPPQQPAQPPKQR